MLDVKTLAIQSMEEQGIMTTLPSILHNLATLQQFIIRRERKTVSEAYVAYTCVKVQFDLERLEHYCSVEVQTLREAETLRDGVDYKSFNAFAALSSKLSSIAADSPETDKWQIAAETIAAKTALWRIMLTVKDLLLEQSTNKILYHVNRSANKQ